MKYLLCIPSFVIFTISSYVYIVHWTPACQSNVIFKDKKVLITDVLSFALENFALIEIWIKIPKHEIFRSVYKIL